MNVLKEIKWNCVLIAHYTNDYEYHYTSVIRNIRCCKFVSKHSEYYYIDGDKKNKFKTEKELIDFIESKKQ